MELLAALYCWSWIVAGAIMCIGWLFSLVHVIRGNKNKWLIFVTSELIVSNIGSVLLGIASLSVYAGTADLQTVLIGSIGILFLYT